MNKENCDLMAITLMKAIAINFMEPTCFELIMAHFSFTFLNSDIRELEIQ